VIAAAPACFAQEEPTRDDLVARLNRLEQEQETLRERIAELEAGTADAELRRRSLVSIYGDIGIRYHMLFEGGTETFNRPEFRLHLGVYGTAYDQGSDRIRYDVRMTTAAIDDNGDPVPTLAWLPLPGYGALPTLAVDRFLIEYDIARAVLVTAGRFPSPFAGTEALFDRDYHFQGLSERFRIDQAFGDAMRRIVPRFEIVGVQSYLAENNLGLPVLETEAPPVYLGGQLRLDIAPFESISHDPEGRLSPEISSEYELRLAAGIHWYDGEELISENLALGYIPGTTNVLDTDGDVQSQFLVGEVFAEVVALRTRRARIKAWFHGLFNFHARPQIKGRDEKNDAAFDAGISWGMERMDQRWDFLVLFRYFYIEADALLPEFNSEVLNTNIKGWEVELDVRVFGPATAFMIFGLTERENHELNGFGLPARNDPNRSAGQSFRIRVGLFIEF
jgi:hypothetical protein